MSEQTPIDPQTPVILSLNVAAINGIIIALSKLPYEQAAGLINVIQIQAEKQIKEALANKTEGDKQ